jgi:hypothetical protein
MKLNEIIKFDTCYDFAGFLRNTLNHCRREKQLDEAFIKDLVDTLSTEDNRCQMVECILRTPALGTLLKEIKSYL